MNFCLKVPFLFHPPLSRSHQPNQTFPLWQVLDARFDFLLIFEERYLGNYWSWVLICFFFTHLNWVRILWISSRCIFEKFISLWIWRTFLGTSSGSSGDSCSLLTWFARCTCICHWLCSERSWFWSSHGCGSHQLLVFNFLWVCFCLCNSHITRNVRHFLVVCFWDQSKMPGFYKCVVFVCSKHSRNTGTQLMKALCRCLSPRYFVGEVVAEHRLYCVLQVAHLV